MQNVLWFLQISIIWIVHISWSFAELYQNKHHKKTSKADFFWEIQPYNKVNYPIRHLESQLIMCESVHVSVPPWPVSENAHNSRTTWYILIQFYIILQEMTSWLSTHSFWHRIQFNYRSPRVVHITYSSHLRRTMNCSRILLSLLFRCVVLRLLYIYKPLQQHRHRSHCTGTHVRN